MKIAIVGAGATGLASARRLSRCHDVTLFEKRSYLGGHIESVCVEGIPIDIGPYSIYKPAYPVFSKLLKELKVTTIPLDMSFLHVNLVDDVVAHGDICSPSILCLKSLLSRDWRGFPTSYLQLIRNLREQDAPEASVGEAFDQCDFPPHFIRLIGTLFLRVAYGMSENQIREMSISRFLSIHEKFDFVEFTPRPHWVGIAGSMSCYANRLIEQLGRLHVTIRCGEEIVRVHGQSDHVVLKLGSGRFNRFDRVLLTGLPHELQHMLGDEDVRSEPLSRLLTQPLCIELHCDSSVIDFANRPYANLLQTRKNGSENVTELHLDLAKMFGFRISRPHYLSVSSRIPPNEQSVITRRNHRVIRYDGQSDQALDRLRQLDGHHHVYLAGAYDGWGLHESAIVAANRASAAIEHSVGFRSHDGMID